MNLVRDQMHHAIAVATWADGQLSGRRARATLRFRRQSIGARLRRNCGAVYYPHHWRFDGKPKVVAQPRGSGENFHN